MKPEPLSEKKKVTDFRNVTQAVSRAQFLPNVAYNNQEEGGSASLFPAAH